MAIYTERVDEVLGLDEIRLLGTGETTALIFALADQAGLDLRAQARLAETLGIRAGPHGRRLTEPLTAKEARRAVDRAWRKARG